MQHKISIHWEQENIFIGLFSICLALTSFVVIQRDEQGNLDKPVDGIQVMSYPPSFIAGAKIVAHRNAADAI